KSVSVGTSAAAVGSMSSRVIPVSALGGASAAWVLAVSRTNRIGPPSPRSSSEVLGGRHVKLTRRGEPSEWGRQERPTRSERLRRSAKPGERGQSWPRSRKTDEGLRLFGRNS